MKYLILLFSAMVLISGCAGMKFIKKDFSKDPDFKYSGGIIQYGIDQGGVLPGTDGITVGNEIRTFCEGREFKKINEMDAYELDSFLIVPLRFYDKRLEFECLK